MTVISKLGLIGDIHCEDQFLALAIKTLQAECVDSIVCTGDIPTGVGDINCCCDLLRQNGIATVRGNHDRWLLRNQQIDLPHATIPAVVKKGSWRFLDSLPVMIDIPTPIGTAMLCHGIGGEDMLSILPDESDSDIEDHPLLTLISGTHWMMLNGHSHRRMVRTVRVRKPTIQPISSKDNPEIYRDFVIINAGTLRRDHEPTFGMIDFSSSLVRFWDIIDSETAVEVADIYLAE